MRFLAPFAVLAVAWIAAAEAAAATVPLVRGENPVFSPDGTRIAFQRLEGDVFKVGIVPVAGGEVEWIESGPGNAAYPAWTPDGALIYMAGNDTETAHVAWKSGSTSGYGLRLWKDGVKRDLTRGRCRDYTPCVSPDGSTVYFVTTRGVESESASFSKAAATRIATIELAQSPQRVISHGDTETQREPRTEEPRILLDSPNGNNSGYVQPAVSPDGAFLVWGQMDSFFDSWRICGMRLGGETIAGESPPPGQSANCASCIVNCAFSCPITPSSLAALSPRWHPGGRLICFTGFHAGDPSWGVWVEDIQTGRVKRVTTGENPCFSPDGATIAFDRDGTVFLRPFGPGDWPDEILPDVRDDAEPERVVWAAYDLATETAFDMAGDQRFAFGDGQTFFLRAKVRLGEGDGVRQLAIGDYAEAPRAFQLYVAGRDAWLATRGFDGKWLGVKAKVEEVKEVEGLKSKVEGSVRLHEVVAVRTPKRLVISVNGGEPKSVIQGPFLALDTPLRLMAGAGLLPGEAIDSIEIGTGWPQELPKAPTRMDLFQ